MKLEINPEMTDEKCWEVILEFRAEILFVYKKKYTTLKTWLNIDFEDFEADVMLLVFRRLKKFDPTRAKIKTYFCRSVAFASLDVVNKNAKFLEKENATYHKLLKQYKIDFENEIKESE